jgi:hypothetical protein
MAANGIKIRVLFNFWHPMYSDECQGRLFFNEQGMILTLLCSRNMRSALGESVRAWRPGDATVWRKARAQDGGASRSYHPGPTPRHAGGATSFRHRSEAFFYCRSALAEIVNTFVCISSRWVVPSHTRFPPPFAGANPGGGVPGVPDPPPPQKKKERK